MWEPAPLQQVGKLLRLDRTIGQDLAQQPQAQRARAQGNDGGAPVRMPKEAVTAPDTLRHETCAFQGLTSSFPVGRGSVLMPRS